MMLRTDIDAIAAAVRESEGQGATLSPEDYAQWNAGRLAAARALADMLAERTKYPPQRWIERNPGRTWFSPFDRAAFLAACGFS